MTNEEKYKTAEERVKAYLMEVQFIQPKLFDMPTDKQRKERTDGK